MKTDVSLSKYAYIVIHHYQNLFCFDQSLLVNILVTHKYIKPVVLAYFKNCCPREI